jgi:hypothetical protein
MELKLQNTIIRSALIFTWNMLKKIWIWKLDDKIRSKLEDKNYRGHGKSCLKMENHENGIANVGKCAVPFAWFPLLGMICLVLYDICLLTPKGPRVFFSKNAPNLPFLAQEAKTKYFSLFCTFNCKILP